MQSSITISTVLMLALRVTAQTTTDPVNSFLSEAFSVYTEVTSILASDASNTASSTSSSITSTSSSSSATTTPSSSTLASSTSSSTFGTSTSSTTSSTRPSSTSGTAAAASTSAAAHSSGRLSSTNLAIILGCVLGALALGLLLLFLVLCCRRRRRSRNGSSRSLSPNGEEIESWRYNNNRPRSRDGLIGGNNHHNYKNENIGTPNMAEHPALANDRNHQNPFVPVPPAPRRSVQNSRGGLVDSHIPGQEPFTTSSNGIHKDHHHVGELAAGAAGAAVGAAALHHHEKNKHDMTKDHGDNNYNNAYDEKPPLTRRPLPANAYPTTTSNDDAYALNKFPGRKNGGAAPPYNGDDYGYGTGPYEAGQRGMRQPNTSAPLSPFNGAGHHRGPSGDNGHPLMSAGAGALGGAALANHHNRDRSGSVPRHSYDAANTRGSNAPLDHNMPQPLPMRDTHPAHDLVSPISSDSYSSATGIQGGSNHHNNNILSGSTATNNQHHIPSEMPGDVPTPPASSSPRHSSSANTQERPRSHSGGAPAAAALAHRRDQTPPNLPSRSPKRTRFSDNTDQGYPTRNSYGQTSSDDSTWRLSSGMPGGWGRASSREQRRDSSPAANSAHLRNAGINPLGRAESPARHSMPAGDANGPRRRLRLADLKREEEERMEAEHRGRQSMGGEWGGGGGNNGHERGQGVGQAM